MWAFAVALVLVVSVAVAAVQFSVPLSNTFQLKSDWSIALFEIDGTTPISEIIWGDFDPGETKIYNIVIENIGNMNTKFSWTCAGLPVGWDLALSSQYVDPWVEGEKYPDSMGPGSSLEIEIALTEVSATAGTEYTIDIDFHSNDNS